MSSEVWLDIKGYENKYQVSNFGNVKSIRYHRGNEGKLLKYRLDHGGYPYVVLCKNNKVHTFKIHRLVSEYFIPNPENKPCVNHKDGNKKNNYVENLEWVTISENNIHKYRVLGKHPMIGKLGSLNKLSKPVDQFNDGVFIATYANARIAAIINNLDYRSILSCCNGNYMQAGGYEWRFKKATE